jgi:hypothetical protein
VAKCKINFKALIVLFFVHPKRAFRKYRGRKFIPIIKPTRKSNYFKM